MGDNFISIGLALSGRGSHPRRRSIFAWMNEAGAVSGKKKKILIVGHMIGRWFVSRQPERVAGARRNGAAHALGLFRRSRLGLGSRSLAIVYLRGRPAAVSSVVVWPTRLYAPGFSRGGSGSGSHAGGELRGGGRAVFCVRSNPFGPGGATKNRWSHT